MSDLLVRVTRIQKFCTHDGPGVRTTIFLKGCPLHCAWCHNPETQSGRAGILFSKKLCVSCGGCESVCPEEVHTVIPFRSFDISKCKGCGQCSDICPTGALERDSYLATVDQIIAEVLRDRAFYGEHGGITLSGGEPMFQSEACIALLRTAKEAGITTAIETSGFFDSQYIDALASVTDTFLWDYKDSDPERHKFNTGHTNRLILQNLRLLDQHPVKIILRCILVAGVNMTKEHAKAIASIFSALEHCVSVELLPYHAYGASKAAQAGILIHSHPEWIPEKESIHEFSQMLSEMGVVL